VEPEKRVQVHFQWLRSLLLKTLMEIMVKLLLHTYMASYIYTHMYRYIHIFNDINSKKCRLTYERQQGCQIFLGPNIPKRGKRNMITNYNKRP
jgi:hypothetical protein